MTVAAGIRYALDPVAFARDALDFDPDPWQSTVLRTSSRRMLINASRQSGKSTTAAALALHTALYRPRALVLLVSPSLRQSAELFKKVTEHFDRLESPPALDEDNRLSLAMESGSRIVSLPGSEATIRGFSGPMLVIEDGRIRGVVEQVHGRRRRFHGVQNGHADLALGIGGGVVFPRFGQVLGNRPIAAIAHRLRRRRCS